MERIIKGLIDVALGGEDEPREEERSRSTWAEVVSSGKQEEEGKEGERGSGFGYSGGYHGSHGGQRRKKEEEEEKSQWGLRQEGQGQGRSDGDWEVVGHKKKPQYPPKYKVPADTKVKFQNHPSEQEYSQSDSYNVDIEPSREELTNLSKACDRLWELDSNRLVPGKDYEIDCGEGKKVYDKGDQASESLFSWLSDDVFRRPTYSRFCSLLDNYNPNEGSKEVVTSQEKHEQVAFIEEISRTAPIKYLHKYLIHKGIASENYEEFKRMMSSLWFDLYGRGGGSSSSSAFEHVFVGEIKGRGENEVSGFHNWIQFYLEEAKGRVDYQGYIFPRRRGNSPDSETQLLTIQFEWNGILKSVSSTLVGVSPEFEIALYTLCFFVGEEDNRISLGPYSVNIKCYRIGNNKIGTVFPISEC
ncbi:poly(U)-specific endoribonuclease protein [Dioscorea alata]|uniref:Poly(U)-specific endoribonuclease protein n=1 Tax=Dioscorea alata TaxID=55571 RepID=A0ACB7UG11_DIOAL|nr:poly(U)-specific endoribonuclease protein [Dioscorea alata]